MAAGDSGLAPPALWHRSEVWAEPGQGFMLQPGRTWIHTDPSQCVEGFCPKGWLLAYPGFTEPSSVTPCGCVGDGPSAGSEFYRGREGSTPREGRFAGPVVDAGSSPAASTDAWRIIDIMVAHLEAKLARVTGRSVEWRFVYLRSALSSLRDLAPETGGDVGPGETGSQLGGITAAPAPGHGGSGIVPGSQHARDCGGAEHVRTYDPSRECGVCENGRYGANCATCGRGTPTA